MPPLTQIDRDKRKIGASDAPLIMANEMYGRTIFDLYKEKAGLVQREDLSRVLRVQMGHFTEPWNRSWYEQETGWRVMVPTESCVHPDHHWMTANLDGITSPTGSGNEGVWEAKHIGPFGKTAPEITYFAQVQHQMAITGFDYAHLSVFTSNDKWHYTNIDRDDAYIAELIEREGIFWDCVEKQQPLPEWRPVPPPILVPEKVVDMGDSNVFADAAFRWKTSREPAANFKRATADIKEICDPTAGRSHGFGIEAIRNKRGLTVRLKKGEDE